MTYDDFQRRDIASQKLCSAVRAILMIYAVKAVTPDTVVVPSVRPRINDSVQRHGAMKSSIEDGDLASVGKQLLNEFDALQSGLICKGAIAETSAIALF